MADESSIDHPLSVSTSTVSEEDPTDTLLINIEQYKMQLEEVSGALESANEEDKVKLQELQLNLISILELTLHQLEQRQNRDTCHSGQQPLPIKEPSPHDDDDDDDMDDEFERFKLEIAQLEEKKEDTAITEDSSDQDEEKLENNSLKRVKELESSLKQLEGQEVRAPFKERWGGFSYHNAIILSVVAQSWNKIDFEDPQVLVLFSQPTSQEMLPCRFFLEGKCKFDESECKFSHGEKVPVEDLREYNDPDRNKITSGSNVLALHEGQRIWHRGKVEDVLEGRTGFSFNCSVCGKVFEVALESMFPVYAEGEEDLSPRTEESVPESSRNSSHSKSNQSLKSENLSVQASDEEEILFVPKDVWLKTSVNTRLGEWEKYTKGIGSKLMAQMGYIVGTGLGPKGEGRVDPVTAYVYPQGVSLDHCMHLKEVGKGGSLLDVEKRLLKQQKKVENKKEQQRNFINSKTSVFDIINNKLGDSSNLSSTSTTTTGDQLLLEVSQKSLKKDSVKELNKKSYHLSSSIEKLKGEVNALNRSRSRQVGDTTTTKAIDKKIQMKMQKLEGLQLASKQVECEQRSRKDYQKYVSF